MAYGLDIEGVTVRFGGKFLPVTKEDIAPGYMTWNSKLEGAFKELDYLLGMVFLRRLKHHNGYSARH